MTANAQGHQTTDDQRRDLRSRFELAALRRMTEEIEDPEKLSPEQICKYVHAVCEMCNKDSAAEKGRAATALVRLRAERTSSSSSSRPAKSTNPYDDPEAPYGRQSDGTPYTQAQFRAHLARSVRDIYGLPTHDRDTTNVPRPPSAKADPAAPDAAAAKAATSIESGP